MTRARILLIAFGLAVCGACSLNPQPFPPAPEDNGDQTGLYNDAGRSADAFTPSPDAGANEDSGVMSGDAGDAGFDAPIDSPIDSPVDAPNDASIDAPELDADPDASSIVVDN